MTRTLCVKRVEERYVIRLLFVKNANYYYYYYYYQLNCYPDWKSKKAIYPKVPAGKAIQ